jgi:hypothetical protein
MSSLLKYESLVVSSEMKQRWKSGNLKDGYHDWAGKVSPSKTRMTGRDGGPTDREEKS